MLNSQGERVYTRAEIMVLDLLPLMVVFCINLIF